MSANEIRPLVHNSQPNSSPYGVYNDDYTPVDEDSRDILRRRRWMKYGGVAAALVVLAAVLTHSTREEPEAYNYHASTVQSDHLFAGLLADEQAFYFPAASHGEGSRRFLKGGTGVDWSYDWATNAKDGAAIGEYYRAKGLAMADYYRSKFDVSDLLLIEWNVCVFCVHAILTLNIVFPFVFQPTYKVAAGSDAADASTWTYDWTADKDRGIALGQHYKAIGDAINAHYREAFDPTYTPAADDDDEDENNRRMLKSKEKKKEDHKKKELAIDMGSGGAGWYDWQTDRDRGMAIGMHYKQMGEAIADHYNQEFNPMYDVNKKAYTSKNWATMWPDYKERGQEIADYYKGKGAAISSFYQGKYDADANNSDSGVTPVAANANAAIVGNNPDAAHIWGLDWKKDQQQAMEIHNDMMKKGLAIGDYYRAKYDPTYGAFVPTGEAPADVGEAGVNADADPGLHNPDLDYPPWGVDAAADRQHGIAVGQYWKQKGMGMGATYKKRGMELGQYYADKYRTMFDPSYSAEP
jgi:hypothetical protein